MCLELVAGLDKTNREMFCKTALVDENGLVLLYKWVIIVDERGAKHLSPSPLAAGYLSYVQEVPIFLERVNFSTRECCKLSSVEIDERVVDLGLHFFVVSNVANIIPTLYAVAHMDDFVAYDGCNEVVFTKAIYTKDKPSKEKMKEYAKMLKEAKCA